jgi:integrase
MTVKLRSFRSGGFEVDIRFTYPDGSTFRRRFKAPVQGKTAARRWGEAREAELLKAPSPKERAEDERINKEVPTLREFGPRYIENHALADQLKASTVDWIEKTYKNHLYPELGDKPLDRIDDEDVQRLKARLADRNRKTVNNVLGILGHTLKTAVEWKVIDRLPCTVRMLKVSGALVKFYDFDDYKRLVEAAGAIDARTHLVVLLGGDAGLRRGEMLGLRWGDVDFKRRQLQVEEAVWERKKKDGAKGHDRVTDTPKGGRSRVVPLTDALFEALHAHRHLRGDHVLYGNDGRPATSFFLRNLLEAAQKKAGLLSRTGGIHILRHTFCSHLAMRGAPAKAIQELAGHADLTTTMRYMHLSPAARQDAIALLNSREERDEKVRILGDIVETGVAASTTARNH